MAHAARDRRGHCRARRRRPADRVCHPGGLDAEWRGAATPLAGCLDVDLGFTPATNLLPIRRLALAIGQRAEARAAYLAFPRLRLLVLPQIYRRLSATRYAYESPAHGYSATLHVTKIGAIADYPGVFELVTSG